MSFIARKFIAVSIYAMRKWIFLTKVRIIGNNTGVRGRNGAVHIITEHRTLTGSGTMSKGRTGCYYGFSGYSIPLGWRDD